MIAIVVAVLIGVAVGLFVATRGSDTPAPTDDSVVDTGVVDTGVVDTGAGAGVTPSSAAATFTPDGDAGGDQP